jgi:serine/threonine protein kinase
MLTSALMQSMLKTKFASAPPAEPFDVRRLPMRAAPSGVTEVLAPELLNDLLRGMFAVDPAQRTSAARCLQHRYFDDVRQQIEAVLEARNDASPATVAFIPMSER